MKKEIKYNSKYEHINQKLALKDLHSWFGEKVFSEVKRWLESDQHDGGWTYFRDTVYMIAGVEGYPVKVMWDVYGPGNAHHCLHYKFDECVIVTNEKGA